MSSSRERIAVLGAGSWGATLASLLSTNGHDVCLWEFDAKAAQSLASTRRLPTVPDLQLPPSVQVTSYLEEALKRRPVVVSATPTTFVRATMKNAKATGQISPETLVVSVSKGLEENSLKRMSQVILEELGIGESNVNVLGGPSHAEEVCRHVPTLTVVAGRSSKNTEKIQALFSQDFFRVYTHSDLIGVEISGALKNIFAIAAGIGYGLGFGDNTNAALLTRGLNEMTRIGVKMGAQLLTFFGLAGMGDLIVTCQSRHSRNRLLGEKIGKGLKPKDALAQMTMVAEGYKTAPAAWQLARQLELDCPLTREIYEVLYQGKEPRVSLHDLMSRQTNTEWQGLPGLQRLS